MSQWTLVDHVCFCCAMLCFFCYLNTDLYLEVVPGICSNGEYDFPAFTQSRTCERDHPATSKTVLSRRRDADRDQNGMLPIKAPGIKRAMDCTNSGLCTCPAIRMHPTDANVGDCLQLKAGNMFVPCEV